MINDMNTKMSIFRNFRLTGNIVWISLFAIGIGLFFIGMPKYTDDYWYMMHLRPWFESQDIIYPEDGGNILRGGIPFREIWATWSEHYGNDNIRFGNLLGRADIVDLSQMGRFRIYLSLSGNSSNRRFCVGRHQLEEVSVRAYWIVYVDVSIAMV